MQIFWDIRFPVDPSLFARIQAAAEMCVLREGVRLPCSVSLCFCGDPEIQEINRQYRGKDASTDVLSFPSVDYPDQRTAAECESLLRKEYDDDTRSFFLGDIFISVPHLRAQAKEYGHSVLREALYLFVHGMCHLMGYDHIENNDRERMRKMEETILSSLAMRDGQDPTVSDEELIALAKDAMSRSYSPYSAYPVGAALLAKDGRVFQGCNVENASLGLTNCAERTAVFKAVSEGARQFVALAIAARTKAWPCGACRQVLNEFAPDLRILISWDHHVEEKNLQELLPEAFGPHSMDPSNGGNVK